ncbi:putative ubiquitin superfamily protein [Senna tora]|uniref:Putative ubiquitin superfamily protein n=1 Tax=Senna tora TaxID=362788 RepID=A0A834TSJ8_9FABA|nr:putative ubiquitin superfamily protein [Senna tora]
MYVAMKVVVENLTGTLFYAQVGNDASVADLKREIEAHQKLPYHRLILILDSDRCPLMNEESSLVDCGVQDGSHIYLFFYPLDNQPTNHFESSSSDFLLG